MVPLISTGVPLMSKKNHEMIKNMWGICDSQSCKIPTDPPITQIFDTTEMLMFPLVSLAIMVIGIGTTCITYCCKCKKPRCLLPEPEPRINISDAYVNVIEHESQ